MEICPLPLKDKGKSGRQHVKLVQPLKPDPRALKVTTTVSKLRSRGKETGQAVTTKFQQIYTKPLHKRIFF